MEVLYTAKATAIGGRDGHVKSSDGMLDIDLKGPKEMGGPGGATNPEQLFAAGYAACFTSALKHAARVQKVEMGEVEVTVTVRMSPNGKGGFILGVHIEATIPEVTQKVADELMDKADHVCPYSNSTRGNIEHKLTAKTSN